MERGVVDISGSPDPLGVGIVERAEGGDFSGLMLVANAVEG